MMFLCGAVSVTAETLVNTLTLAAKKISCHYHGYLFIYLFSFCQNAVAEVGIAH